MLISYLKKKSEPAKEREKGNDLFPISSSFLPIIKSYFQEKNELLYFEIKKVFLIRKIK